MSDVTNGLAHPFVKTLLSRLSTVDVADAVSFDDEMLTSVSREYGWDFGISEYFSRGLHAFRSHKQIVDGLFSQPPDSLMVLDFAAGFGRITRFLAAYHGVAKVAAADIQTSALRFLAEHLGVDAMPSYSDARSFRPNRTFDIVVAHSFFSHLPGDAFMDWLARLYDVVAPGGTLIMSVHDESLIPTNDRDPSGYTFRAVSETDRLPRSDYGSCWVSSSFTRAAIRSQCPGSNILRWPRGLANYQDLYVVARRAIPDDMVLDQGPFGHLGVTRLQGNTLDLVGWVAHTNAARSVASVTAGLNGTTMERVSSFFARPDVVSHTGSAHNLHSGWRCKFALPPTCSLATDVLWITATSDAGAETLLYVGTVASALLASCRAELAAVGRDTVIFPSPDAIDEDLFRT